MFDELMQWIGYAGIVVGYFLFKSSKLQGATVSIVGAGALAIWASIQSPVPWGVFALQITCIGINCWIVRGEKSAPEIRYGD